ncbi:protein of unknown function DUF1818 [Thalassoporum mexicanum PCC 7367]|uniref:DUF1818 family protein n=1 Tax=Thalassoporum mexicanum TaxID=3457544 RepID=UPI00029F9784|nr:DUF1818 family protein [Pseudanabaena sp. PCC 7367]AFY70519.1 protein of unknown function DUF1818 [Pseudanabaena sp. PCC 7367]
MTYFASGDRWRLGYNPSAQVFCGLVGGDGWAIELTRAEIADFLRLSLQLAATMIDMAAELADQEKITCTLESELILVETSGYADRYGLYFQLQTGRKAEGSWSAVDVPELLGAIADLNQAMQSPQEKA